MKRLSLLLLLAPALSAADVDYTLKPLPTSKEVAITITADNKNDKIAFFLPAWVPGFYVIMPHQREIVDVKATDAAGKPLKIEPQTNPREWVVDPPTEGKVTLSYRVKGTDPGLGFFAVNVRDNTAFVMGAAAFMYVVDRKEEPTTLRIENPAGWDVATSMTKEVDGTYKARDYDEFIDHPIDLGKFVKRTFTANGRSFEVDFVTMNGLYSDTAADEMVNRIRRLVIPAMTMFGETPFQRYVFHFHLAVGDFSGGLEHQNSVTIAIPPNIPAGVIDDLITHEFFHAWNVKHIRPYVLGPFDYTKEVRTDNLWFAEGVTDYYAKMHAYRSGLQDANDYLFNAFSNEVRGYQSGRTRKTHTLAQASQGAWEGGSQGTGDLSYYNKGLLAGWILDGSIRHETAGQKSLDDVLRYMFEQYRLPDKPGYKEDGILQAINTVTGKDFTELYDKLIYSTDELPYELLQNIGVRVQKEGETYQALGFTTTPDGVVDAVQGDVRAQGLQQGDKILTINGKPFNPVVSGLSTDGYTVEVKRTNGPIKVQLTPIYQRAQHFEVEADPFALPEAAQRLKEWLSRPGSIK